MPSTGNALKGTELNKNVPVGAGTSRGLACGRSRRRTGCPECEWVAGRLHAPARVPGDHRPRTACHSRGAPSGKHGSSAHPDAGVGLPLCGLAYGRQTRLCAQSPVLACPSGAGGGRRPGSVRGSGWPQAERQAPSTVPSGTFIGGSPHARLPALPTPSLPVGWGKGAAVPGASRSCPADTRVCRARRPHGSVGDGVRWPWEGRGEEGTASRA